MEILHITDLHLDNFTGENEFLRKGFYKEYIDRLQNSLANKINPLKIDYLVVSGDLVNIGKVENFSEVEIIINYISDKFLIEKKNICFSIGNHDYKWKELPILESEDENSDLKNQAKFLKNTDSEKEKNLKIPFRNFRNKFNSSTIKDTDYFFLSKLDKNTYYLSIDSTWSSLNGNPGELSIVEEDDLIECISDNIKSDDTLLIGCHFPIISFDNNFLAGEEMNWHNNHVWIKGNTLRDRIKRLNIKNIVWFHGDVHASDQKVIENETFVLTSKFGGVPDTSEQKRQAVLISINEANISKIACKYEFPTHSQDLRLGDWSCSEQQELRKFKVDLNTINTNQYELITYNQEVENEILRLVKENDLYKFGRFHISEEYVSLGWVDINKLMSDKELLNRISDKCHNFISSKKVSLPEENLILGIEIIGGIIASQLSVRLNIKNSIIPVRSKSKHYSEFEFSHSSAFDNISSITDVFIIIDIISTGSTINSIIEEILTKNTHINIHVISIITNDIENKLNSIPKTKSYITFCTKLKIPIIKHCEMPAEEYVTPNLKF